MNSFMSGVFIMSIQFLTDYFYFFLQGIQENTEQAKFSFTFIPTCASLTWYLFRGFPASTTESVVWW